MKEFTTVPSTVIVTDVARKDWLNSPVLSWHSSSDCLLQSWRLNFFLSVSICYSRRISIWRLLSSKSFFRSFLAAWNDCCRLLTGPARLSIFRRNAQFGFPIWHQVFLGKIRTSHNNNKRRFVWFTNLDVNMISPTIHNQSNVLTQIRPFTQI